MSSPHTTFPFFYSLLCSSTSPLTVLLVPVWTLFILQNFLNCALPGHASILCLSHPPKQIQQTTHMACLLILISPTPVYLSCSCLLRCVSHLLIVVPTCTITSFSHTNFFPLVPLYLMNLLLPVCPPCASPLSRPLPSPFTCLLYPRSRACNKRTL